MSGVDHTFRKVWDTESAAARAKELAAAEEAEAEAAAAAAAAAAGGTAGAAGGSGGAGGLAAPESKGAVRLKHKMRGNLKRSEVVDVDKAVGKRVRLRAGTLRAGYHCKVCDTVLTDSMAYLAHMASRRHAKALGMSMRVENVPAKDVIAHLDELVAAKREARAHRKDLRRRRALGELAPEGTPVAAADAYTLDAAIEANEAVAAEKRAVRKRKRKRKREETAVLGGLGSSSQLGMNSAALAAAKAEADIRSKMGLPVSFGVRK